jgi:hypothetical protein
VFSEVTAEEIVQLMRNDFVATNSESEDGNSRVNEKMTSKETDKCIRIP